jgi:hypothetical protein
MLGYLKLGNKQNKDKITMTETELIELLDNQQVREILSNDSEYIIADLSVFNAGSVLAIDLVNDFPAYIFDENEQMVEGYYIYARSNIENLLDSKLLEALENNANVFSADLAGLSTIEKLNLADFALRIFNLSN